MRFCAIGPPPLRSPVHRNLSLPENRKIARFLLAKERNSSHLDGDRTTVWHSMDCNMNLKRVILAGTVLGLLTSTNGCSTPIKSRFSRPRASAETGSMNADESNGPVLYTDRDALQSGTGVMDDDAPMEFKTTRSGLKYRVLRQADGRKPVAHNTVTCHYRGWLDDGREFDSSYKRGETISFPLSGVIAGWTEGMQLVGTGGMIELWIPSDLGYGPKGSPPSVPPNADLHFIVELVAVK
jgi:FKBP-type peptidyl-prolyl cis-trans isomerase FkpA